MLIENVHFLRSQPARRIGHKALACSISDIAAMGGVPRYALTSVSFPRDLPLSFAKGIYAGLQKTAAQFGISVIGGDTNASDKIIVDVFLCGVVEQDCLVRRSGAKSGDCILVTGTLGGSQSGNHLRFMPRLDAARYLVKKFPIHAMIDISDGLISDLGHILEASKKSAKIFGGSIPCARACSLEDAFYTGEDFELLFTMPPDYAEKLCADWPFADTLKLSRIGSIESGRCGIRLVDARGGLSPVTPGGYRHF